jgi:hypothetical protein
VYVEEKKPSEIVELKEEDAANQEAVESLHIVYNQGTPLTQPSSIDINQLLLVPDGSIITLSGPEVVIEDREV